MRGVNLLGIIYFILAIVLLFWEYKRKSRQYEIDAKHNNKLYKLKKKACLDAQGVIDRAKIRYDVDVEVIKEVICADDMRPDVPAKPVLNNPLPNETNEIEEDKNSYTELS